MIAKIGEDGCVKNQNTVKEQVSTKQTALNHSNKARYKQKLDVSLPDKLTQTNLLDHLSVKLILAIYTISS